MLSHNTAVVFVVVAPASLFATDLAVSVELEDCVVSLLAGVVDAGSVDAG